MKMTKYPYTSRPIHNAYYLDRGKIEIVRIGLQANKLIICPGDGTKYGIVSVYAPDIAGIDFQTLGAVENGFFITELMCEGHTILLNADAGLLAYDSAEKLGFANFHSIYWVTFLMGMATGRPTPCQWETVEEFIDAHTQ